MLVTFDVGNTNIKTIVYDKDENIIFSSRDKLVLDDFDKFINELFKDKEFYKYDYIVSSVVPSINDLLKASLFKYFKKEGHFVSYKSNPTIVKNLDNPAEIGSDLLAAAVRVNNMFNSDSVIIDMGSATKVIMIHNNLIAGISIMLGVENNAYAISSKIKHLPKIELDFSDEILGLNTIDSLKSGILNSALYTVEGFVLNLEKKYGTINKILTGGISNIFKDQLSDFIFIEDLVNLGLFDIFQDLNKL